MSHLLVYSLTVAFCKFLDNASVVPKTLRSSVASKLPLFTEDPFSKLSGTMSLDLLQKTIFSVRSSRFNIAVMKLYDFIQFSNFGLLSTTVIILKLSR